MNDSSNQDTQRLKQMLEEVTAADDPIASHATTARGDAETASLREAWLAFGQLIRAADAALPEMRNLATSIAPRKPGRRRWFGLVLRRTGFLARQRRPRKPALLRLFQAGVIAAVAAALLLAVCLGWRIASEKKAATPAPVANQDLPRPAVVRAEKPTHQTPKAGTPNPSAWADPLETQIATVSRQINSVRQNWQHRVDDVDLVQYRIDEVRDSLQNDAL